MDRPNRSNGYRDIAIFLFFSRCRPSAILDLWNAYLDHPQGESDGLYRGANVVEIDRVVLIICRFSFLPFWLENAYSRPENGGLREFDHDNGEPYQRNPKKHILG